MVRTLWYRSGAMTHTRAMPLLFAAALATALGCDETPMMPMPDAGPPDGGMPPRTREEIPSPGSLVVGIAEARIPAPLGIGTMGFGAIGVDINPTPFADRFPGTTRMQGELSFRAVALSRGPAHELILVRLDTVGIFQQLREAVLDELETRLSRRLDDALVLAGNHTHSGPGRLLMTTGALTALGDTFFPEFYDGVVLALADVIERAIADQRPAELGIAMGGTSAAHSDRRCENDSLPQPQEVPDMPLIAVRRDGTIDALIASYAYHGTVLGIDERTLSGDVGSAIEQKIAERFDHPVAVLFFNSWGADMSPSNPPTDGDGVGADQPGAYDRMDRLGNVVADAVMPVVEAMTFEATPEVRARSYRVPIDRDAIGYDDETFPYPSGGAFCGIGGDGNCEDSTRVENLDHACIRISPAEPLPHQTMISAGQVGALFFVTGSGEWSTALANGVLDSVRASTGGDAMFIGYANDYTGYSLNEDDWWQGGYEASGGLWGPQQGDYLAARTVEAFETFHEAWNEPPWWEPARVDPFTGYEGYALYAPEGALAIGTITEDVAATPARTDIVTFTVNGSDPWLGAPVATLEHDPGDGAFVPVDRSNGTVVDSRSYDLWLEMTPDPPYVDDVREAERTFAWRFHFPVARRARSAIPPLEGAYRFRVAIPTSDGETVVETGTFTVAP